MATSDDTGTYVGDADTGIPADTATRTKGAAEIRKVKSQLAATFPNFTGAAVNTTEAELNQLDGIATGGDTVETRLQGKAAIISSPTTDGIVTQTAGGDIQDSGAVISTDGTLASDSDANIPTEQAVKEYADSPAVAGFAQHFFYLEDRKASGTNGGTFTSGAWQTRDLASVSNSISGASISTNTITLPAGTYYIEGSAPAYAVEEHATRLQNVTDGTTALTGWPEYARPTTGAQSNTRSFVSGVVTIAGAKDFELQHRADKTQSTNGFGLPAGGSFTVANEVFSVLKIWKIAD